MPTGADRVRAEHDLVRQCHGGLDVPALQRGLLRSLRRLLPVDAAFFATADPATLLFTGAFAEEPLVGSTARFLDNELAGDDVNTFVSLVTSRQRVTSLDAATRGHRAASVRYRDIMAPLGLGDELRAALTVGPDCWGYLCLHRTDVPRGFTAAEAALVGRVGPHIAHALRQAALLHGPPGAGAVPAPGVVLLADDLDVVAITPEAEDLLSMVPADAADRLPLPIAVYSVARALRAVEHGTAPPSMLPTVRVRTVTGNWLSLHASRLQGAAGADRISVVIRPAEAGDTVPLLLSAHGLSPRESEIARLVLRGASTAAISDALHISGLTVQDHLKSVFDKIGVRSRRDLVGRLLGQATPGATPPPREVTR